MKLPEPRRLASGNYFIQLRLGGESISITESSRAACIREARAIKAEYLAGKRAKAAPEAPTLTEAIDAYIEERSNTLSPLTIRGYRTIQKYRFQTTMPRRLDQIDDSEWQGIVNTEAALCAPKTLRTAFSFVRGVVWHATGHQLPEVSLAAPVPKEKPFLTPDQIRVFVAAVKDTEQKRHLHPQCAGDDPGAGSGHPAGSKTCWARAGHYPEQPAMRHQEDLPGA